MIEKLGTEEARYLSSPCDEMIKYLEKLLSDNPPPLAVAEVGVGRGATSVEIVKRLRKDDSFYFYSRQEDVDELFDDLQKQEYCKCNLMPFGNSFALYDSYCWNLGNQVIDKNNKDGLFDLVYLDGAHTFLFDGLACALLKQLVREYGYFIFDDLNWSFGKSPTCNPKVRPKTAEEFTKEQIETSQVQMVVDAFMNNDDNWICKQSSKHRAVYQKKPRSKSLLSKLFKK